MSHEAEKTDMDGNTRRLAWDGRPMRRATALVVLDPASTSGMTTADELRDIVEVWRDLHSIELDTTLRERFSPHGRDADGCEVLIFDWGGMSLGNDLMEHQLRWVLQWAEDHPSALVVVRSRAGLYLKHEFLDEQTPLLVNVIVDHGELFLPDWWVNGLDYVQGPEPEGKP